jgi:choline dehydrogenase-like flavoprotein
VTEKSYDAIVVGSGVAGSFAAKELTEHGLEVLLLEAGPDISESDFKEPPPITKAKGIDVIPRFRAGLTGQHVQGRYLNFSEHNKHFYVNDFQNPYTHPLGKDYLWIRGRQLGGRFHTFGRMLLRMSDFDFKAASYDGHGENWPLSYSDIAEYYDKVEEFMGVIGTCENLPQLPDGKYCEAPHLGELVKSFKLKVETKWPERKVIPWRYLSPDLQIIPKPIVAAKATGHLTIKTDSVVKKVLTDSVSGKAKGVEYIERKTKQHRSARSAVVVLCASAIESVRIMLNSACPKHPNGLGNSSGLLGRYFMDHTPAYIYGSIPGTKGLASDPSEPVNPKQVPGGVYIPRSHNLERITHPKFTRGISCQGMMGRIFAPLDHDAEFFIMGFGEMLPYYDSQITVNQRLKDAWGIPVAHVNCAITQNEHESLKEQSKILRELAEIGGYNIEFAGNFMGLDKDTKLFPETNWLSRQIFKLFYKKSLCMGAAIHETGGVRMGDDQSKSVINPYNQCWDVKNLFVTDSSCFVTNGMAGPALTIMAITTRACEYIVKELKRGL